MASGSDAKRRCWGRTTQQKEKIKIIENMELEVIDEVVSEAGTVDLQQPELMSTENLTRILTERKVPIPVYGNGTASRERLLFLFRKHIVPRPQRKNRSRRRYEDAIYAGRNSEGGVAETAMDWENERRSGSSSSEPKLWDGGGGNGGNVLGKRKLLQSADKLEESLPKKNHATPPISLTTPITTPTTVNTTVRKLKRPCRSSGVKVEGKVRNIDNKCD